MADEDEELAFSKAENQEDVDFAEEATDFRKLLSLPYINPAHARCDMLIYVQNP
jgi:hypothetical protein